MQLVSRLSYGYGARAITQQWDLRWRSPLNLLDCFVSPCYTSAVASIGIPVSLYFGHLKSETPLGFPTKWIKAYFRPSGLMSLVASQQHHRSQRMSDGPRSWHFFNLTLADTVMTSWQAANHLTSVLGSLATNLGFRFRTLSTSAHFVPWQQPSVEWTRLTTSWETTWFVLLCPLNLLCKNYFALLLSSRHVENRLCTCLAKSNFRFFRRIVYLRNPQAIIMVCISKTKWWCRLQ